MSRDIWHNADITPYPLKSFVIKTKNDNIYTGIITKPEEWSPLILPEFYSIGDIDNADTILQYAYLDDLLACEQELDRTRKALDVAVDALKEQQRWLGIIRISMVSHLNNEKGTVFQPYDADPTVLNIGKAKVLLNTALEQITALEQKD